MLLLGLGMLGGHQVYWDVVGGRIELGLGDVQRSVDLEEVLVGGSRLDLSPARQGLNREVGMRDCLGGAQRGFLVLLLRQRGSVVEVLGLLGCNC